MKEINLISFVFFIFIISFLPALSTAQKKEAAEKNWKISVNGGLLFHRDDKIMIADYMYVQGWSLNHLEYTVSHFMHKYHELGISVGKSDITSATNNQETFVNKHIKETNSTDLKLNIGLGLIYSYDFKPVYSSVIPINAMFKLKFIDKHIYLLVGADIFTSYKISTSLFFINIIPSIGYDLFKNKLSIYFGAGIGIRPVLLDNYFTLFGRFEYNINNFLSSGIELKHPMNFEDAFHGNSVNSANLFISYNLQF